MFQQREQVMAALAAGFAQRRVLVVGDLMLDRYLWGAVSRVSPEAPVPVVHLQRETERCGGAANVAINLANLGVNALVAGFVGEDLAGSRLDALLRQAGVDTRALVALPASSHPTITKTRVVGGHQQMLRLDQESGEPIPDAHRAELLDAVTTLLMGEYPPAAIILSDYAKGVLSPSLCRGVIQAARRAGVPVLVDPKGRDYDKYRGATTLSPNRGELATATGADPQPLEALLAAGEQLRQRLAVAYLTVTLSELGIALLDGGEPRRIPAMAKEVFDVSGAGDTVIATLAAGLAAGLLPIDALHLANLAAGVVVGKVGTAPITLPDLSAAVSSEEALQQSAKVMTLEQASHRVAAWRQRGERIVFTNGCFDLLHAGHVDYLEKARHLGQRLVVGLNTDDSVRALKGPSRPVIHQDDRARVLAALAAVDAVILFGEETPLKLITTLRPDVLAKGADYTEEQVVGGREVKSWGGEVALVTLTQGRSSSNIMRHIRQHPAQ